MICNRTIALFDSCSLPTYWEDLVGAVDIYYTKVLVNL